MKLVPVPQSRSSEAFARQGMGVWELGRCVAPSTFWATGECGAFVRDDGTGYADIEGTPFNAYVCSHCAARILKRD